MNSVITVVVVLALIWLALTILGALVEGLLWLAVVGLVLLAATVVYGWVKGKARSRG
ncbi:hypothetical protein [Cellulomonas shaoxiangyii]|uniref:hypothetical protein n=1 Tax=Cellulomonas shaoxiangyii TaxID=2566013 RepID=UPI00140BA777|nr:hypothetical protein [Cellulomonas shaoxiangyii]